MDGELLPFLSNHNWRLDPPFYVLKSGLLLIKGPTICSMGQHSSLFFFFCISTTVPLIQNAEIYVLGTTSVWTSNLFSSSLHSALSMVLLQCHIEPHEGSCERDKVQETQGVLTSSSSVWWTGWISEAERDARPVPASARRINHVPEWTSEDPGLVSRLKTRPKSKLLLWAGRFSTTLFASWRDTKRKAAERQKGNLATFITWQPLQAAS